MAAEGKTHLYDEEDWTVNQVIVQEAEIKRLREDLKRLREEAQQLRAKLQERGKGGEIQEEKP